MSSEPLTTDITPVQDAPASERGLLIGMLLIVTLGVCAMFFIG
jgi:hypothetical protein